jgi:hypothetical protein
VRLRKSALITAFDEIQWIDHATCDVVEWFMPNLLVRMRTKAKRELRANVMRRTELVSGGAAGGFEGRP